MKTDLYIGILRISNVLKKLFCKFHIENILVIVLLSRKKYGDTASLIMYLLRYYVKFLCIKYYSTYNPYHQTRGYHPSIPRSLNDIL